MAKKKNMKADKPRYVGSVTFDGNIQVNLHGEMKTLRTDLGGLALQKANPNKELLVLTRDHVGYDEIDTGYIVRSKRYDDGQPPYFGLKHEPNADSWGCHNYCDVIAWGYADGGLNDPTLYYSCQSTVDEEIEREKWRAEHGMKTHAEKLAEMEDEDEEHIKAPHGLVMRFRHKDDQIQNGTMWTKDMGPIPEGFQEKLKVTLQDFLEFTKEHPEFKEMHFYTEPTEWEDEDEETEN
jgi:hypothetical protein